MADFGSIQSCQALTRKTEKRVLAVHISLFLLNIVKQTNAVLRIFDLQVNNEFFGCGENLRGPNLLSNAFMYGTVCSWHGLRFS